MHDLRVEPVQLVLVEPRRRPAHLREREFHRQLRKALARLDRIGRADLRQQRQDRHRLIAFIAQLFRRQRAKTFRQSLPVRADQQRHVRHLRRLCAEREEYLDLRARIRDVILAADHMRDLRIDIVHHRRHGVEERAILADQHRVGHGGSIDRLLSRAPDRSTPRDRPTA
jgi:hypothetical protein